MKHILYTLAILFCCLFSFGQQSRIKRLDGSRIATTEVDRIIREHMTKANVTGMALAVVNNNKVAYTKTYGFKNNKTKELLGTSTILYGASFSKAVFAYLNLILVQEGALDLDKPLYQYLDQPLPQHKGYTELSGDDRWKLITARMCLSHTTGFPNWRWLNPVTGAVEGGGKLAIYFTPGTKYAYSGEGLTLLQMVIEKITGRNLEDLAREKVFKPMGLTRTSYIWQPHFENDYALGHDEKENPIAKKKRSKAGGAGSLETTIADYALFIENVMQGRGLTKQTKRSMLTQQIAIHSKHQFPTITEETTSDNEAINLSYGLGWGLLTCKYGRAFFKEGHDDGWNHYNINFIEKGISIIMMTNSSNGEKIFKDVLEKVIGDTFTPWQWERYIPK
jgi:CubicO group peptidase (beta-lactamase class C family)